MVVASALFSPGNLEKDNLLKGRCMTKGKDATKEKLRKRFAGLEAERKQLDKKA